MLNSNNKPKLCYILPDYQSQSHAHFAYLADFVGEISKFSDIFLIIEKGEQPRIDMGCQRVQVLWFRFLPLRWCELYCRLLYARLLGYKDFYIHYSFLSAFAASLIVKIFGGRTFYWNCGLPWRYKRNFLREWFERLVYKTISFLVTGTEGLKYQYAKHYNLPLEKIKVMPNWINMEKIKNQSASRRTKINRLRDSLKIALDQKVILFVHRLSQRKGARYLPEILKRLTDVNNAMDYVLVVIGDGPERKDLEFRIQNLGLMSKIRFLGWVPQSEVLDYFVMADVFIMPSEEEGFPHVLLEAMAVGAPFVAFDVGGVKEIIPLQLRSYIVGVGDIDAFVAKVKEVLKMAPEDRVKIGELEKKWVEKYDIKKVAQSFSSII